MPCKDAMVTSVISARTSQTVGDVLALFESHRIRGVPVLDENNKLVGLYNFNHMLLDLMPFPVDDKLKRFHSLDINLDHISDAAPWVTKQLGKLLDKKIKDVMVDKPHYVLPEASLREGIRQLAKYGSPVIVVKDKASMQPVGLISSQSVIKALQEIKGRMDTGKEVHE